MSITFCEKTFHTYIETLSNKTKNNFYLTHSLLLKISIINDVAASTGEKQKLQLALTLLKKPEIIFLDESTSFMASRDALTFLNLMKKEFELDNAIIFFSTHDLGLIPFFTQHIALSSSNAKNINAPQLHNEIFIPKITLG